MVLFRGLLDRCFSPPEFNGSDLETHVALTSYSVTLGHSFLLRFSLSLHHSCLPSSFLFSKLYLTTFLPAAYCAVSLLIGSFLMSTSQLSECWIHLATAPSQTNGIMLDFFQEIWEALSFPSLWLLLSLLLSLLFLSFSILTTLP